MTGFHADVQQIYLCSFLFCLIIQITKQNKKNNPSATGARRDLALRLPPCTAPRPGTRRYREAAAPGGEPAPLSGKAEPGVTDLRGQIKSVSLRRAAEAVAPAALGARGLQRGEAAPRGEAVDGGGVLDRAPRSRGALGKAPAASRRCGELRPAAAILRAALPPRLSDRSLPFAAPPPREAAGPGFPCGGWGPGAVGRAYAALSYPPGPRYRASERCSARLCPHTGAYQALRR